MSLTYSQLEGLWIQGGGDANLAPIAAAIALAESGGDPNATNPTDNNGTQTSWGLWQISNGTHAQPVPNILDPLTNAQQAVAKYRGDGWRPWGTYDSGAYLKFLQRGVSPNAAGIPSGSAQVDAANASAKSGGGSAGGGYWGAPYQPSDIPGVPAVIPRLPDTSLDPLTDMSRALAWGTEFLAWGFFIAIVFLLGAVLLLIGAVGLLMILAGPVLEPLGGVIGLTGAGKAAKLAGGATAAVGARNRAASEEAETARLRAGTSEPRNRRQANREADEVFVREGVSRRGPGDRSTRREQMAREYRTHKGRRVPASSSGPAF